MARKILPSILILCVAVLLFVASLYIQPFATSLNLYRPNIARFENKINQKLSINQKFAKKFEYVVAEKPANEVFAKGVELYQRYFGNENVEMLVFRNDSLLYWSSNIDFMPDTTNVQVRIIKKDSDYYLSQSIKCENLNFVFLTSFYVEYPYQNKFLRNGFRPDFSFVKDYRVSQEPAYGAIPVRAKGVEQFYLVPIDTFQQKSYYNYKSVLQWFSVLALFCGLFIMLSNLFKRKRPLLLFVCLASVIVVFRFLSLGLEFPEHIKGDLFGPELFAHSSLSPSLGDFLVNSVLCFILVMLVYRFVTIYCIKQRYCTSSLLAAISSVAVWSGFKLVDVTVVSLVKHSTLQLEAYRIFSVDIYSILAYVALSFIVCSLLIIVYTWFRLFFKTIGLKKSCVILLSTFVLFLIADMLLFGQKFTLLGITMSILVMAVFVAHSRFKVRYLKFSWLVMVIAILSMYSVLMVSIEGHKKNDDIRKVLAINLSSERDPLAELLLCKVSQRLTSDALIRHYVRDIDAYNTELYEYLHKDYFRGYLNKYDMQAIVCQPNSVVFDKDADVENFNEYFENLIDSYGSAIPSSRFYHLNLQNGTISYIGVITYRYGNDVRNLYIELNSRPSWEMLGYPELLIEGQNPQRKLYGYSYAKYHDGTLVNQGGDYPYALKFEANKTSGDTYSTFEDEGYNHLIYRSGEVDAIILSRKLDEPLNITASFVYNLVFFMLVVFVLLRISRVPMDTPFQFSTFKSRVKWAMGIIIILSMMLVATATIIYSVHGFEQRIHKNLNEKLMSVTLELYRDITLLSNIEEYRYELTDRLIDMSNVFYSDINIYDTTGMLVITSRPEIFDKDLMGERINSKAWEELFYRNSQKFVERESIGNISFLSAYVPLIGNDNKTIAYLNLPYFTKEEELKDELYSLVIAIINIYALLLLFAFVVAMVISGQITKPLELIRDRIRRVDISSRNELIEYSGNDEVGQLIGEYNRMVQELDRSAKELAKNQREGAWREMARQVAHEVKNPLTPIKLSLQYLVKSKMEGVPDWDERFSRFAQSLDEQINTLSRIASEFSAFAKLPMAKVSDLDISMILTDVMTVFSGYNEGDICISFNNRLNTDTIIRADRDQVIRVFNNLILNAIQSIEKGKHGEIRVELLLADEKTIRVEVIDNGSGIQPDVLPKLFSPNFTTKSSGTGLGLAISREIVETFGGTIGVKNNEIAGVTFFVEFPLENS